MPCERSEQQPVNADQCYTQCSFAHEVIKACNEVLAYGSAVIVERGLSGSIIDYLLLIIPWFNISVATLISK